MPMGFGCGRGLFCGKNGILWLILGIGGSRNVNGGERDVERRTPPLKRFRTFGFRLALEVMRSWTFGEFQRLFIRGLKKLNSMKYVFLL